MPTASEADGLAQHQKRDTKNALGDKGQDIRKTPLMRVLEGYAASRDFS